MPELALELDNKAQESINALMKHYKVGSRAEIVSKAIAVLKIAAHIEKTHGELFARKGDHETRIIVR
ncbi:MAG TPA: hypothetical protein VK590_06240 [Saprospiraceae bacterium]|nr:hypothetical protein [Saprospiraceae bacterium]